MKTQVYNEQVKEIQINETQVNETEDHCQQNLNKK